jgi:hypothetical protein
LGTPASGNLSNCTFPTLNQNTSGSSASCTGNAATVTNGFYTTSSFNLGTTSIAVNRTSASQSLTGINIDGSSGSCTGNAATATLAANSTLAGGLAVATGRNNSANQIVCTDASGYLQTGYINSSNGDEGNNSSPSRVWGTNGSDSYLRTYLTSALSVNYATAAAYQYPSGTASNANTQFTDTPVHRSSWIECNNSTNAPNSGWHFIETMRHSNASSYWGTQYAHGWEDNANRMWKRNITNGAFGGWVEFITSNNIGSQSVTNATNATNVTGVAGTLGYSTAGVSVGYSGVGGPQVMGSTTNAAQLSFHRAGAYAVNMGLDTDNVFKIGGWSDGAGVFRFQVNAAGLATCTATSARYADLAENYTSDQSYDYGIVLMIGGDEEVTIAAEETQKLAGVVSKNPAYLMNSECEGKHVVAIALQGRTPVRVKGKVNKGDFLVSAGDGYAKATDNPRIGSIIGKSLESFDGQYGMVEAMVGRL